MRIRFTVVALVLAIASVFLPSSATAQLRPRVTANFMMGFPVGQFADNLERPGFGLRVTGAAQFGATPVQVGLDIGYLIYGFERRTEPFSTTIPDVRVRVETTNNIALSHLFFRLQPPTGKVQPYVEGLIGFAYLFTSTSIKDIGSDEDVASSTNFDDFAASYGAGAGIDFHLGSSTSETGRTTSFLLHAGVQYLIGGNAEYLKRGSIRRENGQVTFDVQRSRTDLVAPQLGVTFLF